MRKLIVILLTGWAFALSYHVQNVAADDERNGGIPLRKLAGTYAETIQASLFVCFSTTPPFPLAKCGSAGSTDIPLNALAPMLARPNSESFSISCLISSTARRASKILRS